MASLSRGSMLDLFPMLRKVSITLRIPQFLLLDSISYNSNNILVEIGESEARSSTNNFSYRQGRRAGIRRVIPTSLTSIHKTTLGW